MRFICKVLLCIATLLLLINGALTMLRRMDTDDGQPRTFLGDFIHLSLLNENALAILGGIVLASLCLLYISADQPDDDPLPPR